MKSYNVKDVTSLEGDMGKLYHMSCQPNWWVLNLCQSHKKLLFNQVQSLFKLGMMASSFDTICPKNNSPFSTIINPIVALRRFK